MGQTKYRFVVFGILGIAYLLVFFHRLSPAVMAVDMMRDFQAGGALMGLLASAYFYPYSAMQIPAGLLSDSWGPRRSVTVFLVLAAVGSIGLGLAPTAGLAIAARFTVGLGVALVFVPTMKILTNWFEERQFVRMTGLLVSLGGVGAYTAATPLALMSEAFGWRGSMIAIGIVTAGVALTVWWLVRDTPQEKGYQPIRGAGVTTRVKQVGLWQGLAMVLTAYRFWPMACCFFLSAAVSLTFNGLWGGPFLMHVYHMSREQAGAVLSMMAIGLIVGAPLMSWLSENIFKSRRQLLIIDQLGALILFTPMAFLTDDFYPALLYPWCLAYSILVSGLIVVGYTIIKEIFPLEIAGTATGLVNIFPFAGAAMGQPLMGWYLDRFGSTDGVYSAAAYSAAFKFGLLFILGAVIASFMVKDKASP